MNAKMTPLAVLTAQLTPTADGWQQLLPKGEFRSRDGSPTDVAHWFIDETIARRLIDLVRNLKQDVLVDYEHESWFKAKQGKDAGAVLAAGWFNADEMRWFDDEQRQGLFIKPRWTPKAYEHIKNGEFAFLSAVFPYDEQGIPLEIRMAALTNDPGVTGMQRLAVLSAYSTLTPPQENSRMDLLKQLLAKLGIELAEGTQPTEEQAAQATAALDALINGKKEAEDKVATLSAKAGQVDLTQYVPKAVYDALNGQLAVLSAQNVDNQVEQLVSQARNDGRAIAAEEDYLKAFGKQQGVAALSAMLEQRPKIAALSAQQTPQINTPKEKGTAVLSAAEKEAAKLLGMSEADYAKQLEAK